jgi:hypothetical protein
MLNGETDVWREKTTVVQHEVQVFVFDDGQVSVPGMASDTYAKRSALLENSNVETNMVWVKSLIDKVLAPDLPGSSDGGVVISSSAIIAAPAIYDEEEAVVGVGFGTAPAQKSSTPVKSKNCKVVFLRQEVEDTIAKHASMLLLLPSYKQSLPGMVLHRHAQTLENKRKKAHDYKEYDLENMLTEPIAEWKCVRSLLLVATKVDFSSQAVKKHSSFASFILEMKEAMKLRNVMNNLPADFSAHSTATSLRPASKRICWMQPFVFAQWGILPHLFQIAMKQLSSTLSCSRERCHRK